jgi:hypothetical protein
MELCFENRALELLVGQNIVVNMARRGKFQVGLIET